MKPQLLVPKAWSGMKLLFVVFEVVLVVAISAGSTLCTSLTWRRGATYHIYISGDSLTLRRHVADTFHDIQYHNCILVMNMSSTFVSRSQFGRRPQ